MQTLEWNSDLFIINLLLCGFTEDCVKKINAYLYLDVVYIMILGLASWLRAAFNVRIVMATEINLTSVTTTCKNYVLVHRCVYLK